MTAIHSEFIAALFETLHSYVTTTAFMTLPIYYKLQNAHWIAELECVQKIPVFYLMFELNGTVKLYRAASKTEQFIFVQLA